MIFLYSVDLAIFSLYSHIADFWPRNFCKAVLASANCASCYCGIEKAELNRGVDVVVLSEFCIRNLGAENIEPVSMHEPTSTLPKIDVRITRTPNVRRTLNAYVQHNCLLFSKIIAVSASVQEAIQ